MVEEEGWTPVKNKRKRGKQRNQQNGSRIQANDDVDKSWGVFVVSPDQKVLLLKHKKRNSFWSFSKGHKENKDMSDVATAIRELKEESNLVVCKLWKKTETWEEYCSSATERNDSGEEPSAFRTFAEQYRYTKHEYRNRQPVYVQVPKKVTFFVAKTQASSSEVVVNFSKSKGEITGYKWVNLHSTSDQVKELTTIPGSTRGKNGMYSQDLALFKTIKQVILGTESAF
ncbi:hypothetical protein P3T76_006903 [Phytophthora citrophthora]|uniref:Nudix hydrolase domain-containing protein n=1 Tax=Phytophthora citrophthora TaxID=4793 RepID=A0AAD9GNU6_9STRA|nr:hypothetical protein P3T76_006903 [Phytophthora citrophthora]